VFLKRRWLERWRVADARLVLTEPSVVTADGERVTVADHYGVYVRLGGGRGRERAHVEARGFAPGDAQDFGVPVLWRA
jgi:hypothetical protein